ncbi:Uncharacterized protein APZ42_004884 [Daphnia magna]|uniref:Uncharacterized protein n=1 Tax=Daphnia magna TaxID=35525 RepID=A0A164GSF9_9CRUS|nr:Uncharacterized protein APZ42_004884 [Daphnia magna]
MVLTAILFVSFLESMSANIDQLNLKLAPLKSKLEKQFTFNVLILILYFLYAT